MVAKIQLELDDEFEHLLEKRKAENIKFVLKSLKP